MGTVGSTKVKADGPGNRLLDLCERSIKSRLWELIAKFDSNCYYVIAAALNPQAPPPCPNPWGKKKSTLGLFLKIPVPPCFPPFSN